MGIFYTRFFLIIIYLLFSWAVFCQSAFSSAMDNQHLTVAVIEVMYLKRFLSHHKIYLNAHHFLLLRFQMS